MLDSKYSVIDLVYSLSTASLLLALLVKTDFASLKTGGFYQLFWITHSFDAETFLRRIFLLPCRYSKLISYK